VGQFVHVSVWPLVEEVGTGCYKRRALGIAVHSWPCSRWDLVCAREMSE